MNWQNIPTGLEVVRRAVVPKQEGWALNSFDYSKIEPRLLAYFASKKGDDTLASYLRQGRDPYRAVVAGIYGKAEHELTEKEYKSGKILFLSLMYGGGVRTVEAQHGVGRNEAKAMIKKFHTAWPIVRELQDDVVRIANRRGYIKTPWGRRLHLEEFGEHKLLNKLIQGSAAHLLKLSLVRVHDHLKANPERRSHLVLTIHDELVLDGPLAETRWLHETIPPLMDDPIISAVVPILVDHDISPTHWAERIDYDDWASMEAGKAT